MKTNYTIGLDLGTSSVKGVLACGNEIVAKESAKFEYKTCYLPNKSEYLGFDAEEFFEIVAGVIKKLAALSPEPVTAISMASASGNTLLCDERGKPMISVYTWINPPMPDEIQKVFGNLKSDDVAKVTGWPFWENFPLAHLAHLKVNAHELLKCAKTVCMSTEYLQFRLTGKWAVDRSTATPSYLTDQVLGKWHKPYLNALGISEKQLPPIFESGSVLGKIERDVQEITGLSSDTTVYLGSFDHPAGAIASGVVKKGELLLSCGTSWVCFFPHEYRDLILAHDLLCDPFLTRKGLWGAMFSLEQVADMIDVLVCKYISNTENRAYIFDECAANAKSGADGLKIDLFKDYKNDFGNYSKENIARAIMESTAYEFKNKLEELKKVGVTFEHITMAGGPSNSKIWRQILEEIIQMPIDVKFGAYNGAMGAALIAQEKAF